jgi:hypothetical protein
MVFPASPAIKLIRVMCMERETLHGHYHPQLSNFAESNQLQTLCQRTSAQSPEVSRIVILHVHKIADYLHPRDDRKPESPAQGNHRAVDCRNWPAERALDSPGDKGCRSDIELFWTTERLCTCDEELCINASNFRQEKD